MDNITKQKQLQNLIYESLHPLINNDYVLWDLPYHYNIGDTLIWEGELSFLEKVQYKCLDYCSIKTCTFPKLEKNIIILLHGGGNFGDIWRNAQEFRLDVINHYSDNTIILFPQTVYYKDDELMKKDAQIMSEHKKLILCARDQHSYSLLKNNFKNEIYLLPDMAFCISNFYINNSCNIKNNKDLFVKRIDKEAALCNIEDGLNIDIRDWPTIEKWKPTVSLFGRLKLFLFSVLSVFQEKLYDHHIYLLSSVINKYAKYILKPFLIKEGVFFLHSYNKIYTTRLHAMILASLLGKEVAFLDNYYGKCYNYYSSWLMDVPSIYPYISNENNQELL